MKAKKFAQEAMPDEKQLSSREREIMNIVYASGEATSATIREAMDDAPGSATVRKLIQILEAKGHLKHKKAGREHVYQPVRAKQSMARRAMQGLLDTFFEGSLKNAIATHLTGNATKLSEDELRQISKMIEDAQAAGGATEGKGGKR
jgi:predicted transcriptional regulator